MHTQVFLLALVAPLAFSLPQPIAPSDALAANGNSTGGGQGGHYKEKHHGPPGGRLPERDLVERQDSGNSTGGAGEHRPHDFKGEKSHGGPPHPERDLGERQEPGNSTGGAGAHRPHDFKGEKSHGGPPHPTRDLGEGREPGNSTSAGEHRHGGHPGPKVDKRIEEANGTTGGYVGEEKFKPDGHHGGPQRPGEDKRSSDDVVLNRRQDNSTSSGEEWEGRHKEGKGHLKHKGPE